MKATVCAPIAPLYAQPARGTLIDEALFGMTVTVCRRQPGWCEIVTHYRYGGWVPEDCLCFENAESWENAAQLVVLNQYADILDAPKVQGVYLAAAPRGSFVVRDDARADENGWMPVLLPDGRAGWTPKSYLAPRKRSWDAAEEPELRKALCESALTYLGAQYRWGGKTPLGLDCSGLVSMAYMLNGIVIYRDAKIMDGFELHRIDPETVKPGDLLFFPGHVAMYLGEGRFIHSTGHEGSEGCCIASLNEGDEGYRGDLKASMNAAGSIF